MDRLPGRDDLLEHGVESTRSELLLQMCGGQRIWRTQRSCGHGQRDRPVGATVRPGLGDRLDEGNVHAPPVEGPNQAEAGPGQAGTSRGGDDQQGPGHDITGIAWAEDRRPAALTRAVSRAISSSSSVGTTSARTGPATLMRPPVRRPWSALAWISSARPRKPSWRSTRLRTTALFSPIPPVKTSA